MNGRADGNAESDVDGSDGDEITGDLVFDVAHHRHGFLFVPQAQHHPNDLGEEHAIVGQKEIEQDEHDHRAGDELRPLGKERFGQRASFHDHGLRFRLLFFRRSQLVDLAGRLSDFFDRFFQWQ